MSQVLIKARDLKGKGKFELLQLKELSKRASILLAPWYVCKEVEGDSYVVDGC